MMCEIIIKIYTTERPQQFQATLYTLKILDSAHGYCNRHSKLTRRQHRGDSIFCVVGACQLPCAAYSITTAGRDTQFAGVFFRTYPIRLTIAFTRKRVYRSPATLINYGMNIFVAHWRN